MNADGINGHGGEGAFIVSADQHDPLTALKMVQIMRLAGLEVQQAEEAFVAGGKSFPAGSFIVPLAQPYRPYAITLLDKQKYPDMRQFEGGPPIAPYDNTAWTLPYLMGVSTDRVEQSFTVRSKKVDEVVYPSASMPAGKTQYLVLDASLNAAYAIASGILAQGGAVSRALQAIKIGQRTFAPGAFVVKNEDRLQSTITGLLQKWHVTPAALGQPQAVKTGALKKVRIGLYQSYQSNMDEGWTRFVLDDLNIPYVTLHNQDIKDAKATGLQSTIDVLILASEDADIIVNGQRAPLAGRGRGGQGIMPAEFAGGIGRDGVDAIRAFVAGGGTLVTVGEACALAFRDLDAPAADALRGVERTKFFLPNSIVRIAVNPDTPLGFGMPANAAAMFSNGIVMDTVEPGRPDIERQVVARYPDDNLLLSGWLIGGERMARKAAVVEVKQGKGRMALLGFRPFYRGQSHGTYKFLLNAIFYPEGQSSQLSTAF
jgi:hypothetical protein